MLISIEFVLNHGESAVLASDLLQNLKYHLTDSCSIGKSVVFNLLS